MQVHKEEKMNLKKVDFKKIYSLTPDEMILASVLEKAAKKANEAREIISKAYLFKIGEDKKLVWKNGTNEEYMSHNGIWECNYVRFGSYYVRCSEKDSNIHIFYFAQSLVDAGYVQPEEMFNKDTTYKEMRLVALYFDNFVQRTRIEYKKNYPGEPICEGLELQPEAESAEKEEHESKRSVIKNAVRSTNESRVMPEYAYIDASEVLGLMNESDANMAYRNPDVKEALEAVNESNESTQMDRNPDVEDALQAVNANENMQVDPDEVLSAPISAETIEEDSGVEEDGGLDI